MKEKVGGLPSQLFIKDFAYVLSNLLLLLPVHRRTIVTIFEKTIQMAAYLEILKILRGISKSKIRELKIIPLRFKTTFVILNTNL